MVYYTIVVLLRAPWPPARCRGPGPLCRGCATPRRIPDDDEYYNHYHDH